MTLQEILDRTNNYLEKDMSGNTLTPEAYNNLIESVNLELFQKEYLKIEIYARQSQIPIHRALYNASGIRPFKKNETITGLSGGSLVYSDKLSYLLMHPLLVMAFYNGIWRKVEVLTDEEMGNRRAGVLNNLSTEPACVLYDDRMQFYPTDVNRVELTYLKEPSTPYYDYCVNNTNNTIIYMPIGSKVKYNPATHKFEYYDENNILQYNDVTHNSNWTGAGGLINYSTHNSDTVELEWLTPDHIKFANMLLEAVGIRLREVDIAQYADKESKEEL